MKENLRAKLEGLEKEEQLEDKKKVRAHTLSELWGLLEFVDKAIQSFRRKKAAERNKRADSKEKDACSARSKEDYAAFLKELKRVVGDKPEIKREWFLLLQKMYARTKDNAYFHYLGATPEKAQGFAEQLKFDTDQYVRGLREVKYEGRLLTESEQQQLIGPGELVDPVSLMPSEDGVPAIQAVIWALIKWDESGKLDLENNPRHIRAAFLCDAFKGRVPNLTTQRPKSGTGFGLGETLK